MRRNFFFNVSLSLIFGFLFCQIELSAQEKIESDSIFRYVDEMPEFPGGNKEMYTFLQKNLKYPEKALDKHIQGTVLVEFVIEKDGSISNITTPVSAHPALDEEAIRVVKMMPKWKPGKQENKAVRVFYQLPIMFNFN